MIITFTFNEQKATQLAAKFLSLNGGRMSKLKLMTLLYLADRFAMERWGEPMTGDKFCSMKQGPVLSRVLDILDKNTPAEFWGQYIQNPGKGNRTVALINTPGEDEFCKAEKDLIERIDRKFKLFSPGQLAQWCHENLLEWKHPGKSSTPISYEQVFEALGKTFKEVQNISEELRSYRYVDEVLGRC